MEHFVHLLMSHRLLLILITMGKANWRLRVGHRVVMMLVVVVMIQRRRRWRNNFQKVTVGCRVTQIDGRLNQSQSHFPVHFLLSNSISVPINEQKNG
jgi:hypothetical protein